MNETPGGIRVDSRLGEARQLLIGPLVQITTRRAERATHDRHGCVLGIHEAVENRTMMLRLQSLGPAEDACRRANYACRLGPLGLCLLLGSHVVHGR
jgi:hypothetical protein